MAENKSKVMSSEEWAAIHRTDVTTEVNSLMRNAYLQYSVSANIGRAIPDVRDGLKPGARRILYAMLRGGYTYAAGLSKCAKVVGLVIGNYHPHGDTAVYDTIVRMAQDFTMRTPLIIGHGNFGSMDGDPAAAYRYTSNAAATMIAINTMLKLKASQEELCEIGLKLGADVPFFIINKPSKVTGIGEVIEPIKVKKQYHCIIIKPEKGLLTSEVYARCDDSQKHHIDTAKVIQGLREGNDLLIEENMGNDLMPVAEKMLPEVGEIYSLLRKNGFGIASMSGSGSSLFALTADAKKARDVYHKLEKTNYTVILTNTL